MNIQEIHNNVPLLNMGEHVPQTKKRRRQSATTISILAPEIHPLSSRLAPLRRRSSAILRCLIHIPPIAITLGVLTLTFRSVFWSPPAANTNSILNSIQFAAQVHTSLIATSLAAILLYYVHICLRSKAGVPLGFLSSNFQLHSLTYMFSSEFRSLHIRFILVFLPLFVLGLLAGPSSAIIMLPRLQFWSVPKLWVGKGNLDFKVFIGANESSLYPSVLTSASSPSQCLGNNASILSECPSSGIRYWLQQDSLFTIYRAPATINKSIEQNTVWSDSYLRYMVGKDSGVNQGVQDVYLTSTLSNFVANALATYGAALDSLGNPYFVFGNEDQVGTIQHEDRSLLARYDLSLHAAGKELRTRKPLSEVECSAYQQNTTSLALQHGEMAWPPWNSDPIYSADWEVQASDYASLSQNLNSNIVNSSFIDTTQFGSIAPSLAAIFATPALIVPGSKINQSLFTCTIDARWMPTTAFWDSSSRTAAVYDSNPNPQGAVSVDADLLGLHPYALDMVSIEPSFAELLDVPWMDSILDPIVTNRTILDVIGQKCLDSNTNLNTTSGNRVFSTGNPMAITSCLEVALAIYIADAMSRLQDSTPIYLVASGHIDDVRHDLFPSDIYYVQNFYATQPGSTETYFNTTTGQTELTWPKDSIQGISMQDFEDASRFLEMRFRTTRWGYGYGFEGSRLIYVGTVVLLLHALLCLVFVVWVVAVGERQGGTEAWDTIAEMLVLGMRSGAMVGKEKTEEGSDEKKWKDRYVVEEVGAGKEAETSGLEDKKELVLRRVGERTNGDGYDALDRGQNEP